MANNMYALSKVYSLTLVSSIFTFALVLLLGLNTTVLAADKDDIPFYKYGIKGEHLAQHVKRNYYGFHEVYDKQTVDFRYWTGNFDIKMSQKNCDAKADVLRETVLLPLQAKNNFADGVLKLEAKTYGCMCVISLSSTEKDLQILVRNLVRDYPPLNDKVVHDDTGNYSTKVEVPDLSICTADQQTIIKSDDPSKAYPFVFYTGKECTVWSCHWACITRYIELNKVVKTDMRAKTSGPDSAP